MSEDNLGYTLIEKIKIYNSCATLVWRVYSIIKFHVVRPFQIEKIYLRVNTEVRLILRNLHMYRRLTIIFRYANNLNLQIHFLFLSSKNFHFFLIKMPHFTLKNSQQQFSFLFEEGYWILSGRNLLKMRVHFIHSMF